MQTLQITIHVIWQQVGVTRKASVSSCCWLYVLPQRILKTKANKSDTGNTIFVIANSWYFSIFSDTDAGHTCMKSLVGYDDKSFPYADPKEAALAIVEGIAKRKRRIFFPSSARVIAFLSDWAPGIHGNAIGKLFATKKNPWTLED